MKDFFLYLLISRGISLHRRGEKKLKIILLTIEEKKSYNIILFVVCARDGRVREYQVNYFIVLDVRLIMT